MSAILDKVRHVFFLSVRAFVIFSLGLALPFSLGEAKAASDTSLEGGPSVFCHVTDGHFTDCNNDGDPLAPGDEWSDILRGTFSTEGVLYADQADLANNGLIVEWENGNVPDVDFFQPDGKLDHLMLMYENPRSVPLGSDEYVTIHFKTVGDSPATGLPVALVTYVVRVFGDGTFQVFVDGVEQGLGGRQTQIFSMIYERLGRLWSVARQSGTARLGGVSDWAFGGWVSEMLLLAGPRLVVQHDAAS